VGHDRSDLGLKLAWIDGLTDVKAPYLVGGEGKRSVCPAQVPDLLGSKYVLVAVDFDGHWPVQAKPIVIPLVIAPPPPE
jgi:hypothetical protein